MKIEFRYTSRFKKNIKPLAKKYRSLKSDLDKLENELRENPFQGVLITDDTYKVRLAIKSKGRGKSGGARVITHLREQTESEEVSTIRIYFIAIYDKSESSNLKDVTIQYLIEEVKREENEEQN